jgi:hypothetical protein
VQGRADDPVAAARGRRLDPLGAAPGQQFPRTRSARRSAWQTLAASHSVSLPPSSALHSRNQKWRRTCARWYSNVRPDHS